MYKTLLNKGFIPVYYTNETWFQDKDYTTRLFYRYEIDTKELFHCVLNILNIYDKYFSLIEDMDAVIIIEVDENLQNYCLCFYNTEEDIVDFEIPKEKIENLLNILPNAFHLEHNEG